VEVAASNLLSVYSDDLSEIPNSERTVAGLINTCLLSSGAAAHYKVELSGTVAGLVLERRRYMPTEADLALEGSHPEVERTGNTRDLNTHRAIPL
jgi:hypothetical protein